MAKEILLTGDGRRIEIRIEGFFVYKLRVLVDGEDVASTRLDSDFTQTTFMLDRGGGYPVQYQVQVRQKGLTMKVEVRRDGQLIHSEGG